jgi:Na+/H+ antiporter NhaA
VNVHASSYDAFWGTTLSIDLGGAGVALDLRHWVNSGLMTFFFFVIGLEARREFDLGELRERRRFALPLLAGSAAWRWQSPSTSPSTRVAPPRAVWGIAMSTDTAFALGLLALVGPRFPDRLRAFMLTVVVVDDIVALVVIATVYTETLRVVPLVVAIALFGAVLVARSLRIRAGLICAGLGIAAWVALLESGVEPVVIGLRWACWPTRSPRLGQISSARRSGSASSASSASNPQQNWHGRPAWSSGRQRRSTNGCSSCFTPGRAT